MDPHYGIHWYKQKQCKQPNTFCQVICPVTQPMDCIKLKPWTMLVWLCLLTLVIPGESKCRGCDAVASYYITSGANFTYISTLFDDISFEAVQRYNPAFKSKDILTPGQSLSIPFHCDCLGSYLGHTFKYKVVKGDTYEIIAANYSHLTSKEWIQAVNPGVIPNNIPIDSELNITVNCSCGNPKISKKYGLFLTYPLVEGDNLANISKRYNVPYDLLQKYNAGANFSSVNSIVFLPVKDATGEYPAINTSGSGIRKKIIPGTSAGAVVVTLVIVLGLFYFYVYKHQRGTWNSFDGNVTSIAAKGHKSARLRTMNMSIDFPYEELAAATNGFNNANMIGKGGFGEVYIGKLRGEMVAIKKMSMQSKESFLAELKVLTRVHHANLVRLIGFCAEESLFLVYEYIHNGSLDRHLHGLASGMAPLTWPHRVQIMLDAARGLEYIHEHTVPGYIHRDIKSANILIDESFHGKVADFGLTKLVEVGGVSTTNAVGTFGYMSPEYVHYGTVTPKLDVYAFGVVLYEIISGKKAIEKDSENSAEQYALVTLFEAVLKDPSGREKLHTLIDPKLGNCYPLDSVWKVAQFARACTQDNPQLRPTMQTAVIALLTLLTEEDMNYAYEG